MSGSSLSLYVHMNSLFYLVASIYRPKCIYLSDKQDVRLVEAINSVLGRVPCNLELTFLLNNMIQNIRGIGYQDAAKFIF
jgi:hypothetical protein